MVDDFVNIKTQTVLSPTELEFSKENPAGLTKEGCMQEIKNWKLSTNKYAKRMYEYMLTECKNFSTSGKTVDGKTIMARKEGKITWAEKVD
tara:strand:+ start:257 stop:529 length:273 start_codon:yes stop_codon:yes gene_type:complete